MRIKFVSQYFHPEPFSNANIVNGLLQAGHQLSVMTAVPNYGKTTFYPGFSNSENREGSWQGVPIERVWTYPRGKSNWQLILNYIVFAIMGSLRARKVPKGEYDLVFVSLLSPIFMALPAIVVARKLKIPLVFWLQDLWPESATENLGIKNRIVVGLLNRICGSIYRQADLLLVQSEAFPQYMLSHGVEASRIRVFPNTAPDGFDVLSKEEAERPEFLPESGFNIMYAGNVGEAQGFDNIVEAAKLIGSRGQINWVIVGQGRALEALKKRVSREGLSSSFVFPGRFPEEAMPHFFAHADAMLVTLKDFPIFALTVPYKMQTYMACGRPILAALNGEGARKVEESGAGVAVPAEDAAALADGALALANASREELTGMGAMGRDFFLKNYAPDIVFGNLRRWLEETATTAVLDRPDAETGGGPAG